MFDNQEFTISYVALYFHIKLTTRHGFSLSFVVAWQLVVTSLYLTHTIHLDWGQAFNFLLEIPGSSEICYFSTGIFLSLSDSLAIFVMRKSFGSSQSLHLLNRFLFLKHITLRSHFRKGWRKHITSVQSNELLYK